MAAFCEVSTFSTVSCFGNPCNSLVASIASRRVSSGSSAFASCVEGYDLFMLAVAAVFSLPVIPWIRSRLSPRTSEILGYAAGAALFAVCVITLSSTTFNPFIYFRF